MIYLSTPTILFTRAPLSRDGARGLGWANEKRKTRHHLDNLDNLVLPRHALPTPFESGGEGQVVPKPRGRGSRPEGNLVSPMAGIIAPTCPMAGIIAPTCPGPSRHASMRLSLLVRVFDDAASRMVFCSPVGWFYHQSSESYYTWTGPGKKKGWSRMDPSPQPGMPLLRED